MSELEDNEEEPKEDIDPTLGLSEDEILEEIDKALAKDLLKRAQSGTATAGELQTVLKYLSSKGYKGASPAAIKKTGVTDDPRLKLDEMLPDNFVDFINS